MHGRYFGSKPPIHQRNVRGVCISVSSLPSFATTRGCSQNCQHALRHAATTSGATMHSESITRSRVCCGARACACARVACVRALARSLPYALRCICRRTLSLGRRLWRSKGSCNRTRIISDKHRHYTHTHTHTHTHTGKRVFSSDAQSCAHSQHRSQEKIEALERELATRQLKKR